MRWGRYESALLMGSERCFYGQAKQGDKNPPHTETKGKKGDVGNERQRKEGEDC
jgi:hypothetical protein